MVTQLDTKGKKRFINKPKILKGKELRDELQRVVQSWDHNWRNQTSYVLRLGK